MTTDTNPLPDFTNFSYKIVTPSDPVKGRGWDKLKECERRLALYRWAERLNAPPEGTQHLPRPPHQVFLDDCLSAFLMTLEATLQFTGDQLQKQKVSLKKYDKKKKKLVVIRFEEWLRNRPSHDRYMRGLRALRHFAAHVEIKPVRRGVNIRAEKSVEARPGWHQVTESTISHRWSLPQLTRAELTALKKPELNFKAFRNFNKAKKSKPPKSPKLPKDLEGLRVWNRLVFIHEAGEILEHSLRQAQAILLEAERLL